MREVTYEGRDLEVLADMPNYYSWIMETFSPYVRGRVIEYGAGSGTVSKLLASLGDNLTLVEPSINLAENLHQQFDQDARFEVVCETLETHVLGAPESSASTIVLVNVLEHIEDDCVALLRLLKILEPGGHLLIFVPAMPILMSQLDRIHGHFRRYTKSEITQKVSEAGGKLITCRYFDVLGVLPWLILNKIMCSTGFNPALVRLNDRFIVPTSRFIERRYEPVFGKNLILVATKSAH
jgi:SAM-dependent methyltransferase